MSKELSKPSFRLVRTFTQQKYLEDRLAYLAYYDPVTNMPNKSLFCDRLDMAIARIKHRERLVAIMIVGTDNFGMVIDTIGRDNADKILVELAQRLMSVVRDGTLFRAWVRTISVLR